MTDTATIDESTGAAKAPDTASQEPEKAAQAPEIIADAPIDGPNSAAVTGSTIPAEELERLTGDIIAALKSVYDPEIPADIYEIGLIYKVDIDDNRDVTIDMTLTAPGCPVAGEMPIWVENAVASVPGVASATAMMVFDPPWSPDRMSDEAKVAIGWW